MGLVDPSCAQLLGGGGAGSEVFLRHQATRVSPGGCNSSLASVPLSGPAPRACYCRCRASSPPPHPPSPLACLCPLIYTPAPPPASRPYEKQFGVPQQCPCPVPPSAPLLSTRKTSPHPIWFQGLCPPRRAHHAKPPTWAGLHPTGPSAKAQVALATKGHCWHPDVTPQ